MVWDAWLEHNVSIYVIVCSSWIRVEAKTKTRYQCWAAFHAATSATQMSGERCLLLYKKRTHALPDTFKELKNAFQLARITWDACTSLPSHSVVQVQM